MKINDLLLLKYALFGTSVQLHFKVTFEAQLMCDAFLRVERTITYYTLFLSRNCFKKKLAKLCANPTQVAGVDKEWGITVCSKKMFNVHLLYLHAPVMVVVRFHLLIALNFVFQFLGGICKEEIAAFLQQFSSVNDNA